MALIPTYVSPNRRTVVVPYAEKLIQLYPEALPIKVKGQDFIALPHDTATTFTLQQLGYGVVAPVNAYYEFPGGKAPFDIQKMTVGMLTLNKRAYVLNDMGTGKTKTMLWAWDWLNKINLANRLLVCAPLSTLKFVWGSEVFATLPHRKAVVLHGSKQKRLKLLEREEADIFIVNHDGLRIIEEHLPKDVDSLVIDELAVYRNAKAARTKRMIEFSKTMKWAWGATGSPMPTSPMDVWAQSKILTPDTTPTYAKHFKEQVMYQVAPFKFVPKEGAVNKAFSVLRPAVRFTLEDVVELPDCVSRFMDVDMAPATKKIYKSLASSCHAAVQNGEITAVNAGAVMMKLLQVAAGWVYINGGDVIELPNDTRKEALITALESTQRKVLVFIPFIHALKGISEFLTHAGYENDPISGETPESRRAEIFNAFQFTDKYHVLPAHPQCLAHGITLTAADTIIWYAPITSLEIYDQANRRIRRIGQYHKQQIIHFQSTPVEKRVYSLLQSHANMQSELLNMFAEATKGL